MANTLASSARSDSHAVRTDSGFSTLEAIVAIGILGIALVPLYGFQVTLSDGVGAIERKFASEQASTLTRAYLSGLQPAGLATGAAKLGKMDISWTFDERQPGRPALAGSGLPGRFKVNRVEVAYTVSISGRTLTTGRLERLFWTETSPFFTDMSQDQ